MRSSFSLGTSSNLGLWRLLWIKDVNINILRTLSLSLSLSFPPSLPPSPSQILTCWLLFGGCACRSSGWRSINRYLVHHQLELFSWRSGRRWLDLPGTTGTRDIRTIQSRKSFAKFFIIMNLPLLQKKW